LRGIALGRRAWLFAGSDRGGERAAFMYTLIVTALCRMRHRAVYAEHRTMPRRCSRGKLSVEFTVARSA
jgi:transposase